MQQGALAMQPRRARSVAAATRTLAPTAVHAQGPSESTPAEAHATQALPVNGMPLQAFACCARQRDWAKGAGACTCTCCVHRRFMSRAAAKSPADG